MTGGLFGHKGPHYYPKDEYGEYRDWAAEEAFEALKQREHDVTRKIVSALGRA